MKKEEQRSWQEHIAKLKELREDAENLILRKHEVEALDFVISFVENFYASEKADGQKTTTTRKG